MPVIPERWRNQSCRTERVHGKQCLMCEAGRRADHEQACTAEDCPMCTAIYDGLPFCTLAESPAWQAPEERECGCPDFEVEPECELCADWLDAHCAPGWGACRAHGYLAMHAHRYRTRCVVPYRGGPCELAERVWHYRPEPGKAVPVQHVHCPECAAERAVVDNEWARRTQVTLSAEAMRRHGGQAVTITPAWVPLCPGCRKLVTPEQTGRLAAILGSVAS